MSLLLNKLKYFNLQLSKKNLENLDMRARSVLISLEI